MYLHVYLRFVVKSGRRFMKEGVGFSHATYIRWYQGKQVPFKIKFKIVTAVALNKCLTQIKLLLSLQTSRVNLFMSYHLLKIPWVPS